MDLNKSKNLLIQKIKNQLSKWFESEAPIGNSEVYSFLHSLNGNAAWLQLEGFHHLSGQLMGQINGGEEKSWNNEELRRFLNPIIHFTNDYDSFLDTTAFTFKEGPNNINVPIIQIIDDDISMLILLKDTIEEKGWRAVVNTDPVMAISQYNQLTPDCVIIDLNDSRSGLEFLESIEQHTQQNFIPKIILSWQNDRETRINAYKRGVDGFIEKPIDLEELTVRIDRLLKRKELVEQALDAAKAESKEHVEVLNNSTEFTNRNLFVSIIDDDPIIRTMLMRILKVMDFSNFDVNFEEFGDGLQFFKSNRLEEKGDHFLIIDGVMPIMDGIEVLQKVKEIKHSHNIYVLMLTGRKSEADIERALALGADDYVTKPFSIKELQARIQRLIKRMK
ncbi:response regulator [Neobacillus drentensis]|uniref:response regulator n=1 Tax=Neobacillus drentensis TaxID=220684 RepID=UPI003000CEED